MCERRSHRHSRPDIDNEYQSDFPFGERRKHRHHHRFEQFWSEPERETFWPSKRPHHHHCPQCPLFRGPEQFERCHHSKQRPQRGAYTPCRSCGQFGPCQRFGRLGPFGHCEERHRHRHHGNPCGPWGPFGVPCQPCGKFGGQFPFGGRHHHGPPCGPCRPFPFEHSHHHHHHNHHHEHLPCRPCQSFERPGPFGPCEERRHQCPLCGPCSPQFGQFRQFKPCGPCPGFGFQPCGRFGPLRRFERRRWVPRDEDISSSSTSSSYSSSLRRKRFRYRGFGKKCPRIHHLRHHRFHRIHHCRKPTW